MNNDDTYLSVIATSRNDDHGGNLLDRTQIFVNGLLSQCRKYNLKAELILVEWNPPADRPSLADVLLWPADKGPCTVRIIQVPSKVHRMFKHSGKLPLFQMIAKNVGIRRARGRFVLATNIDIIFSDELMKYLASLPLEKGFFYRVDRYDVPTNVPLSVSLDEQLEFCKKNYFRINRRDGSLNIKTGEYNEVNFTILINIPDPFRSLLTYFLSFMSFIPYDVKGWLKKQKSVQALKELIKNRMIAKSEQFYTNLHTNACGDFTLMTKEDWFDLRGYAEFEIYSFHIDSLLCYAAHSAGVKEKFLDGPMMIYHIEHATGSGWTPEGQQHLNARLKAAGIPQLGFAKLCDLIIKMQRNRRPTIFNNKDWGLVTEDLHEIVI